jgi:hypothetical protein
VSTVAPCCCEGMEFTAGLVGRRDGTAFGVRGHVGTGALAMRRADPAGSGAWIQRAVQGGVIPVPAFACGNKERCSRGVVGMRRRQAAMVRPDGMADGMLTPASLKTQRRQD